MIYITKKTKKLSRAAILILSVLLTCFASNTTMRAQTCTPAPVGLVSWYSGDGNALDSRSRNDGVLNGSIFVAGKVGQAFQITNPTGIRAADNASLNQQNFTLEAWVTAQTYNPSCLCNQFFAAKDGSNQNFGYSLATASDGSLRFTMNGGAGGADLFGSTIANGSFHHVAATYDGATMKIYLDGALNAQTPVTAIINYEANSPFVIGSRQNGSATQPYNGLVDELGFYNRVLTGTEIAAIFNAQGAGKCKPTATVAPSGQVLWLAGDGNPNDISGSGNNGTLNGAGFALGKAGQSFNFDGIDDFVEIADSPSLRPSQFTLETWVQPSINNVNHSIITKEPTELSSQTGYGLRQRSNNKFLFIVGREGFGLPLSIESTTTLMPGVWYHLAATFDGSQSKLYINGILEGTGSGTTAIDSTFPVRIGRLNSNLDGSFQGQIDEASLYNRALTDTEIAAIVNAGSAGKLKTVSTLTGFAAADETKAANFHSSVGGSDFVPQSVNVTVGDATVTFPSVTSVGTTQEIPLVLSSLPPLRSGSSTGLTYDISTSAVYTGMPTVCFNLPALSASFPNLRIYHLESGAWMNRTAPSGNTPTNFCTSPLSSLSPFAIVQAVPTAAAVSVGGRVLSPKSAGISKARVTLTDSNGETRPTITNAFGYYRFDDVEVGRTYILKVSSKQYQFLPQAITATDNIENLDFTANSPGK